MVNSTLTTPSCRWLLGASACSTTAGGSSRRASMCWISTFTCTTGAASLGDLQPIGRGDGSILLQALWQAAKQVPLQWVDLRVIHV